MYAYALNNPLKFVDPTGYDCAYLNNSGNGIESLDQNSNSDECTKNGGYWADGAITNFEVNDNGSYRFTSLDADLHTLYTNFSGAGNSSSTVYPDVMNYFMDYYLQLQQPQQMDPSLALATGVMSQGIPKACAIGFSGNVGKAKVGVSASGNGVGGNINGHSAGTETPQASGVDMRSASPAFKSFPVGVYLSPNDPSGNSVSSVSVGVNYKGKIGPVPVNISGQAYMNTGTYTPNVNDPQNCPN